MTVAYAALLALLALPSALAASGFFNYDPNGSYGPSNWGTLAIDNNQCSGQKNSPIAVTTIPCTVKEDYTLTNGNCTVDDMTFSILNIGVQANYAGNCTKNTLKIPGIDGTYEALQFHIHTSSEHTIDGESFGAELHIVHKQTGGDRYAVVGMMIEATSSVNHEAFESLLGGWAVIADNTTKTCRPANTTLTTSNATSTSRSSSGRKHRQLASSFNAYDMVPKGSTFYHYDGGLTTPPCSEVVWWNLADTPVSISVSQFSRLTQYILEYTDPTTCNLATVASSSGSTSRPVQALNGRVVKRICPKSFVDPTVASAKGTASAASFTFASMSTFLLVAAAFTLQVF